MDTNALFKLLGLVVMLYTLQALLTGKVYAKYRVWGRTFRRDDEPGRYWSTIGCYVCLAVALFFLFGSTWRR